MNINFDKLIDELTIANIKFSGISEKGIVWAEDGKTEIQDRKDVKAVIAAHDPTPEKVETLDEKIERVITEKLAATKG